MKLNVLLVLSTLALCSALKPNIVFFLVDDLGSGDLSSSGSALYTPNIDALRRQHAVDLTDYTLPSLCSPTRTSLMAARYPYSMGLGHLVITEGQPYGLPLSHKTLPSVLLENGYSTHGFGKADIGACSWGHTPAQRGFESFLGYWGATQDYYTHMRGGVHVKGPDGKPRVYTGYDFRDSHTDGKNNKDSGAGQRAAKELSGNYSTTVLADSAISIIQSHAEANTKSNTSADDKPLFLYFASQAVHTPLELPPGGLRPQCAQNIPADFPHRRIYCSILATLDDAVGRIVSELSTQGMLENTLFIFSNDNGGHVGQGARNGAKRGEKSSCFQGGVSGPAFVASYNDAILPSAAQGTKCGALVNVADWLPTIVGGVLGLNVSASVPQELDGVNQWDVIVSPTKCAAAVEALRNQAPGPTAPKPEGAPRTEALLHLDPIGPWWSGALRQGRYKVIVGIPTYYQAAPNTAGGGGPFGCNRNASDGECPVGWTPEVPGLSTPPPQPKEVPVPGRNYLYVWTFDLLDDPTEHNDITETHMHNVTIPLLDVLEQRYNSSQIPQLHPEPDYRSDPAHFNGSWTPWLPDGHCADGGTPAEGAPRTFWNLTAMEADALLRQSGG